MRLIECSWKGHLALARKLMKEWKNRKMPASGQRTNPCPVLGRSGLLSIPWQSAGEAYISGSTWLLDECSAREPVFSTTPVLSVLLHTWPRTHTTVLASQEQLVHVMCVLVLWPTVAPQTLSERSAAFIDRGAMRGTGSNRSIRIVRA